MLNMKNLQLEDKFDFFENYKMRLVLTWLKKKINCGHLATVNVDSIGG